MSTAPQLSVVLPVHNEAESLRVLWPELRGVLDRIGAQAEVLFVDDGSTDASAAVIRKLVGCDPRVRLIRLAKNYGLTAAFHAGLAAARGEIVVTMDADLQSDPNDIPMLLDYLATCDAATGWRKDRRDPWSKRAASVVANAVRNAVSGDRVRDSACSLRVMHRACLGAIPPYHGMHRFVPSLLRRAGYRVVEVPVHHRPRRFGRSKFTARGRAIGAFVDLLAVCWMSRRQMHYALIPEDNGD